MRSFISLTIVCTLAIVLASPAAAQTIEFNFLGNGGPGLNPGNNVGPNTATPATSSASGGEVAGGLVFNTATNILNFDFEFEGISGLFTDALGGIHLHLPTTAGDPFNNTGAIVFSLNQADANVALSTPFIAPSATSGRATGTVSFANNLDDVDDLLAGEFYLNIHGDQFNGGEIRGTLVAVPEPTTILASCLALLGVATLRRR